jgi:hypothetical protein
MLLNGFTGRTVRQVERQDECLKIQFEDGGYLFVRAKGPVEASLTINCMGTQCNPTRCTDCHGIEQTASE